MSLLCSARLRCAKRALKPRYSRGVMGQFDHLPLPLPYSMKDGLGKFLPPPALETVAMDYQLGLLKRLTEEVRNTEEEGQSVTQVILSTAPYREKTLAFNYASLALNNSFFLGQLTPNPELADENRMGELLRKQIQNDHGSLDQLKSTFSAAAMGLSTSGWIWFVSDQNGGTAVLPTLGPGTLLVRSRTYMATNIHPHIPELSSNPDEWDPSHEYTDKYLNQPPPLSSGMTAPPPTHTGSASSGPASGLGSATPLQRMFMHTSARRLSAFSAANAQPAGIHDADSVRSKPLTTTDAIHTGKTLYPLFCVSVHEHAWLSAGYGVWGKEEWLREFWSVLNWERVGEAYEKIRATTA
ncbi:unnamed protein product [Mycena citricolor]|uniref:Manganese/iron superoxide dismutase C-terminal domain-containing protein n=1 Tax=Mycena citricolor TaxID=2018698 RepID=A0AAD2HLM9_9AGAR|nr:unnamed protein product [Mycena citricolor]CAK5276077.1 unnamed protein product [Mycena citricolor]